MSDVQLFCGDCLEILPTLKAGSIDAVVTDPPYNSSLKYGTYSDNRPTDEYWRWMMTIVKECQRVARNMVVVKHSALKIIDWCKYIGFGRMVVWYKPFSSGFPMNGLATHFEPLWIIQGKTSQWSKDVIEWSAGNCNREQSMGHPAQMPEGFTRRLIDICTQPGDTILDPFMGSGTTGVACVQTGRNFIGIEIDPHYYAIAEKRINEAQMQMRMDI